MIFTAYKEECYNILSACSSIPVCSDRFYYNHKDLVFPYNSHLSVSIHIQLDDFGNKNRIGVIYDYLSNDVYIHTYQDSFTSGLFFNISTIPVNIEYRDSRLCLSDETSINLTMDCVIFRHHRKFSQIYEYKGWSILFDRILVVDKLDIEDFIISYTIHTLVLGSNALTGVTNLVVPKTVEYLVYPELLSIRKTKAKRKTIYIDAEKQYTVPFLTKVLATLEDCSIYDIKEPANILASRIKECGIGIEFI